jgi:uncharacterized membrane protein
MEGVLASKIFAVLMLCLILLSVAILKKAISFELSPRIIRFMALSALPIIWTFLTFFYSR